MPADHQRFMRMAVEEAERAAAEGNDAIGSVVVQGDSVVVRVGNEVTTTVDPTAHAEIVALRRAARALGDIDCTGCTLYTTMQPCPMCCGAIMESGISTLVIGARPDPSVGRYGGYTPESLIEMVSWGDRLSVVAGVLADECAEVRRRWQAAKETP